MKTEWQHVEESDVQLEYWVTTVEKRVIKVFLVEGEYYWSDNQTGRHRNWGQAHNLEDAMRDSLS